MKAILLKLVLITLLAAAWCQAGNSSSDIDRIICLSPNLTEIVYKLGKGDSIVGVTSNSNFPSSAKEITRVGTFWQPDIEAIIALKPDIVLTLSFQQQRQIARQLQQLGLKVKIYEINDFESFYMAAIDIGKNIGKKQAALKLVENIKTRLNEQKKNNESEEPVRLLWVVQSEPLRVVGQKSFVNKFIDYAGGKNAIGETIQKYPSISSEELIASEPEVIIISSMTGELENEQLKALKKWSRFPSIPAVKNGRIFVINADSTFRLGPRINQGVDMIAEILKKEGIKGEK